MKNPIRTVAHNQMAARPSVRPRWPKMLAVSRDLRNLAAITRACAQTQATCNAAWPRIEAQLLDVVGWFAADRRLDSSRHWDVAKRELRRLLNAGVRQ